MSCTTPSSRARCCSCSLRIESVLCCIWSLTSRTLVRTASSQLRGSMVSGSCARRLSSLRLTLSSSRTAPASPTSWRRALWRCWAVWYSSSAWRRSAAERRASFSESFRAGTRSSSCRRTCSISSRTSSDKDALSCAALVSAFLFRLFSSSACRCRVLSSCILDCSALTLERHWPISGSRATTSESRVVSRCWHSARSFRSLATWVDAASRDVTVNFFSRAAISSSFRIFSSTCRALEYRVAPKISSNFCFKVPMSLTGQVDSSWWQKMTFSSMALGTPIRLGINWSMSAHRWDTECFWPSAPTVTTVPSMDLKDCRSLSFCCTLDNV
mmetsp:Transcript_142220/g.318218  ORF Transcript_142220/g.318218 Transcript_142220/m.318218 type:complete len:328 (-) Transcript_142220:322-1305(-)